MKPRAVLIRTPTEFGSTTGGHDFMTSYFIPLPPEVEPEIRRVVDSIFTDLEYVGGDPDLERAYLSGIEEPLKELAGMGLAIFAVTSESKMALPEGKEIPNWRRTRYMIVMPNAYFQLDADEGQPQVHRYRSDCEQAVRTLLHASVKEVRLKQWMVADAVSKSLERNVPWCPTCCMEESLK